MPPFKQKRMGLPIDIREYTSEFSDLNLFYLIMPKLGLYSDRPNTVLGCKKDKLDKQNQYACNHCSYYRVTVMY
jgi:hypothetical protein